MQWHTRAQFRVETVSGCVVAREKRGRATNGYPVAIDRYGCRRFLNLHNFWDGGGVRADRRRKAAVGSLFGVDKR